MAVSKSPCKFRPRVKLPVSFWEAPTRAARGAEWGPAALVGREGGDCYWRKWTDWRETRYLGGKRNSMYSFNEYSL